jgi:hypothetical protein
VEGGEEAAAIHGGSRGGGNDGDGALWSEQRRRQRQRQRSVKSRDGGGTYRGEKKRPCLSFFVDQK